MLEALNAFCVTVVDYLLGWSLYLPRFVVLMILAVGTALILTLIRKVTTNQDRLGRAKADRVRQRELLRQAKQRKDKEAIARHRATLNEISVLNLKSELMPLLISLVPIALLAVWAFARIGYLPPAIDARVTVKVYFPTSEIGNLVHIVPASGLRAEDTWIRRIAPDLDGDGKVVGGVAAWALASADGTGGEYVLSIRYQGGQYDKDLIIDGHRYADPARFYDGERVLAAEVLMTEYHPLGIVPGIAAIALPPWLIGYLIIVIPLSLALKPLLRIY